MNENQLAERISTLELRLSCAELLITALMGAHPDQDLLRHAVFHARRLQDASSLYQTNLTDDHIDRILRMLDEHLKRFPAP